MLEIFTILCAAIAVMAFAAAGMEAIARFVALRYEEAENRRLSGRLIHAAAPVVEAGGGEVEE